MGCKGRKAVHDRPWLRRVEEIVLRDDGVGRCNLQASRDVVSK